jgi:hypothetical protein
LFDGSEVERTGYQPVWVNHLADHVTIAGSAMNDVVQGAEAVRSIVTYIRTLYDSQEFNFAGPPGVRARAIASSASEASSPDTFAPRRAAALAAWPEPQAMSSNSVPGPTPIRSNGASLTPRAYGSIRYA